LAYIAYNPNLMCYSTRMCCTCIS